MIISCFITSALWCYFISKIKAIKMCNKSIILCSESSVISAVIINRGKAEELRLGSQTRSSVLRFPAAFAFLCEKITLRQPGLPDWTEQGCQIGHEPDWTVYIIKSLTRRWTPNYRQWFQKHQDCEIIILDCHDERKYHFLTNYSKGVMFVFDVHVTHKCKTWHRHGYVFNIAHFIS